MSKTLLVLPCNSGAEHGSYYAASSRSLWSVARQIIPPEEMTFAAVDCITIFHVHDNLGSLVFEDEMERVLGYNAHPNRAFTEPSQLGQLVEGLKFGLQRATSQGFDRIFALLDVFWYRCCFNTAVYEMDLWDRVTSFEIGMMGLCRSLVKKASLFPQVPPGIVIGRFSNGINTMYYRLPKRFRYLELSPRAKLSPELLRDLEQLETIRMNWSSFD